MHIILDKDQEEQSTVFQRNHKCKKIKKAIVSNKNHEFNGSCGGGSNFELIINFSAIANFASIKCIHCKKEFNLGEIDIQY